MPFLAFYIYHIHYLFYIHFDYGYNMKVNVATGNITLYFGHHYQWLFAGVLSSIGWFIWCLESRYRRGRPVRKCVLSLLLLNGLLLLEVYDFPPIGFVLDAHSLWHLGTIPIPLLWFRYLIPLFGLFFSITSCSLTRQLPNRRGQRLEGRERTNL